MHIANKEESKVQRVHPHFFISASMAARSGSSPPKPTKTFRTTPSFPMITVSGMALARYFFAVAPGFAKTAFTLTHLHYGSVRSSDAYKLSISLRSLLVGY